MYDKDDVNGKDVILAYEYKRGEVYSGELFEQKLLFSGMNYHRNITPTDIDLFLDFNGELFIYGEAKKAPAKLTTGQKKALTHLVDSHTTAGHKAIAFFFQHNISAPEPVFAKNQEVIAYYMDGSWNCPKEKTTVHELINKMINWCKKKNINL